MTYITLGWRTVNAALDTTGLNPGKYTNFFDAGALNVNIPRHEVYAMTVTSVAQTATVIVYVNARSGHRRSWSGTPPGPPPTRSC
jgi:hypothetical protein